MVYLRTGNPDSPALFILDHVGRPVYLRGDCLTLGRSGLKKFLYPGQTAGDIKPGDTAGMEGTQCELGARFTDTLRGNYADGGVELNDAPASQVSAIAHLAHAPLRLAEEGRPDLDSGYPGGCNFICFRLVNFLVSVDDDFPGFGVDHRAGGQPADGPLGKGRQQPLVRWFGYPDAIHRAAVLFKDDDILGDVNEAPGKVTAVRCPQRRVGQSFAGTVGGDKVFQNTVPFAEARLDRKFDYLTGRVGHQAAHAGHLRNLGNITLGARGGHHVDAAKAVKSV